MKRLLLSTAAVCIASAAFAANVVLTPVVPPTETGENSAGSQQITDTARLKVGSCTATTTGAEPSLAATCNGAAGVITTNVSVTKVSGAIDNITVTDDKVQAGDMVQCEVDSTGAAAAAAPVCSAVQVSAGQVIFQVTNVSATSPAHTLAVYFLVNTQGNPN